MSARLLQPVRAPLPVTAIALAAGSLVAGEAALVPHGAGVAEGAQAGALMAAALLVLRWAPAAGVVAVVSAGWLARSGPLGGDPAIGIALAVPVAAFAAAACTRARWAPVLLAAGAGHVLAVI